MSDKPTCPKCGSHNIAGLIGAFYVPLDEAGDPEGQWRDWESNTELGTARSCSACGLDFEEGDEHPPEPIETPKEKMTADVLLALLANTDPRRNYYARSMVANTRSPVGGRIEETGEFHLIISPGFNGERTWKIDGQSWEELLNAALEPMRAALGTAL